MEEEGGNANPDSNRLSKSYNSNKKTRNAQDRTMSYNDANLFSNSKKEKMDAYTDADGETD